MKKRTTKSPKLLNKNYPRKSSDVPVTQTMLFTVRDELTADIREVKTSMESGFKRIDARFAAVDAKFSAVDGKFSNIDSKFLSLEAKLDARFNELISQMHQQRLLVEEQNARNVFVLDGLTNLFDRQDRLEAKLK